MADNCNACADLKKYAPQVITRGITDEICESLQNNTGLNPARPGHDNCEALNDLLGCLIGNLHDRLPSFGICDWREFMDEFLRNLYVFQDAMVCSKCGLWAKLGEQENRINNLERILSELLRLLRPSGAWTSTGNVGNVNIDLSGRPPSPAQTIATGNINLFGNAAGSRFIRTNQNPNNPQDIRGGLT